MMMMGAGMGAIIRRAMQGSLPLVTTGEKRGFLVSFMFRAG
jgi:hypothetical protein